jgi:hypothetical protein
MPTSDASCPISALGNPSWSVHSSRLTEKSLLAFLASLNTMRKGRNLSDAAVAVQPTFVGLTPGGGHLRWPACLPVADLRREATGLPKCRFTNHGNKDHG